VIYNKHSRKYGQVTCLPVTPVILTYLISVGIRSRARHG